MTAPSDQRSPSGWRQHTTAGPVALLVGVLLLGIGLLYGRPDAALVGLPLVAFAVMGSTSPGSPPVEVRVLDLPTSGAPADLAPGSVPFELVPTAPPDADLVVLRVSLRGDVPQHLVVLPGRPLRGCVVPVHSGPQQLVSASAWLVAHDGSEVDGPSQRAVLEAVVAAAPVPLGQLPLSPRPRGLSGGHDAARPGKGGAFRDIGRFAPGDRLRSVDWKVTARRAQFDGDLFVRRTTATADATVVVAVDSRDDVGARVSGWAAGGTASDGPTSLDLARRAAVSLVTATIRDGDRAGFLDLGTDGRDVPAGAGHRHLQRLVTAIAGTQATGISARPARTARLPADALVHLIATFLDETPADAARAWLARGHRVVAVVVLPPADLTGATEEVRLAHRVVTGETAARLAELRSAGADVVRWQTAGSDQPLAVQLHAVSRRRTRAPRP